jgi:hypothetical protein
MPSTSSREEIQVTLCFKKKILARLVMDFKDSSAPNFARYIECIAENRYADLVTADRGNVDIHKPQPIVKPKNDTRGRPRLTANERAKIRDLVVRAKLSAKDPAVVQAIMEES